jgi:integrase
VTGQLQKERPAFKVISEGPVRINRTILETAWRRRGPGGRLIFRDETCRGLSLIVNATSMSWSYSYRPRGTSADGARWPNRTVKLGDPASMGPDEARQAASRVKGAVAAGDDPAADRKIEQAEKQRQRANTLALLLTEYAVLLPRRPKLRGAGTLSTAHATEEFNAVKKAVDEMEAADRPPEAITPVMIRRMLAPYGAHPSAARHRFGALSRFMDWLVDDERLPSNPCNQISRAGRPKSPQARSRYLMPADLARLWHAAETMIPVHRDLVRFLIAVPCRRGEAAALDWRHLDLAGASWAQPAKMTKNGEPHRVHLHTLALTLLRGRHAAAGEPAAGLVFAAPVSGKKLTTWPAMQGKVAKNAGLAAWSWHDFRRSFASALGEAGVSEVVADAILNHRQSATRGGVMGVYQRSGRWAEQCAAMVRWSELLTAAIEGKPSEGAEVIPLRRAS